MALIQTLDKMKQQLINHFSVRVGTCLTIGQKGESAFDRYPIVNPDPTLLQKGVEDSQIQNERGNERCHILNCEKKH